MTTLTTEEIVKMATQAGMRLDKHNGGFVDASELKRFAKLVADVATAKERDAMIAEAAKQGWVMKNEDPFEDCVKEIAEIRARGEA